eukprot:tig00000498_g1621.t1
MSRAPRDSPPRDAENPLTRRPDYVEPSPRGLVNPLPEYLRPESYRRHDRVALLFGGSRSSSGKAATLTKWAVGSIVAILFLGLLAVIIFAVVSAASPAAAPPGLQRASSSPAGVGPASEADVVRRRTAEAVAGAGISVSAVLGGPGGGGSEGGLVLSLRSNVSMPGNVSSAYFCRAFALKGPRLSVPYHATRFEGHVLSPHLHHMLLFGCLKPVDAWRYERYYPCPEMEDVPCNTIIAGTADQPDSLDFPPSAGMPLGKGAFGDTYVDVLLQWHYTPKQAGAVDTSGFDLHLTPRLRPHSIGSIAMWYPANRWTVNGTALAEEVAAGRVAANTSAIEDASAKFCVASSPPIPPRRPSVDYVVTCPPINAYDSLLYGIPPGGANLTHVWPHMHLTGSRIWAELYRRDANATEGLWRFEREIYRWDSYYFHGQRFFELERPVLLLPSDRLVLHCEFNTTERSEPTRIGNGILDEMCNLFMVTVPRVAMAGVEALARARGREPGEAAELGSLCLGGVLGWPAIAPRLVSPRPAAPPLPQAPPPAAPPSPPLPPSPRPPRGRA